MKLLCSAEEYHKVRISLAINLSNIHDGGALQVGRSVVLELRKNLAIVSQDFKITFLLSKRLYLQLSKHEIYQIEKHSKIVIIDIRGFQLIKTKNMISEYHIVFTLFGPLYSFSKRFLRVTGFAQSWIAYPRNEVWRKLGVVERIKNRFKFFVQRKFFELDHVTIVEARHLICPLVQLGINSISSIRVIENCVSDIFISETFEFPNAPPLERSVIKLGILSRYHAHKNIDIMKHVLSILNAKGTKEYRFFVTFTDSEWKKFNPENNGWIMNMGEVSINKSLDFYREIDGIVFPSLLESFSVTPLEALACGLPVFLGDREFNVEVVKDNGIFFDPNSAEDIASKVLCFFENGDFGFSRDRCRDFALNRSSPSNRALNIIGVIKDASREYYA